MNEMEMIRFHSQNGFAYISGTVYHSDPCLYVKRTGGNQLSEQIRDHTVAFIQTDILRKIGVTFFYTHPVYMVDLYPRDLRNIGFKRLIAWNSVK